MLVSLSGWSKKENLVSSRQVIGADKFSLSLSSSLSISHPPFPVDHRSSVARWSPGASSSFLADPSDLLLLIPFRFPFPDDRHMRTSVIVLLVMSFHSVRHKVINGEKKGKERETSLAKQKERERKEYLRFPLILFESNKLIICRKRISLVLFKWSPIEIRLAMDPSLPSPTFVKVAWTTAIQRIPRAAIETSKRGEGWKKRKDVRVG